MGLPFGPMGSVGILKTTKRIRGPAPTSTVTAAEGRLRRTAALTAATTAMIINAIARTYALFLYHTVEGALPIGGWAMSSDGAKSSLRALLFSTSNQRYVLTLDRFLSPLWLLPTRNILHNSEIYGVAMSEHGPRNSYRPLQTWTY